MKGSYLAGKAERGRTHMLVNVGKEVKGVINIFLKRNMRDILGWVLKFITGRGHLFSVKVLK